MGLVEFCSFQNDLQHGCNAIFSANKYIRKMRGGSQSILVQANDGRYYIVKMMGNPQGVNTLANEYMGTLMAQSAGLPVANHKAIYLSDSFIDSDQGLWFELPTGRRRPNKGVHYASLLVGQPSGTERVSEYISPSRIGLITNRESFLGMYILDVWANHVDNRQAVLRRRSSMDNSQEVIFIDHGYMFGGPNWDFKDRPGIALHLETSVYSNLWNEDKIASWISLFKGVLPEVMSSLTGGGIMDNWHSGDLNWLLGKLSDRLANLSELVQTYLSGSLLIRDQKSRDEAHRVQNTGIHDLGTPDARSSIRRDSSASCA